MDSDISGKLFAVGLGLTCIASAIWGWIITSRAKKRIPELITTKEFNEEYAVDRAKYLGNGTFLVHFYLPILTYNIMNS